MLSRLSELKPGPSSSDPDPEPLTLLTLLTPTLPRWVGSSRSLKPGGGCKLGASL
jgi:hypothetical protein